MEEELQSLVRSQSIDPALLARLLAALPSKAVAVHRPGVARWLEDPDLAPALLAALNHPQYIHYSWLEHPQLQSWSQDYQRAYPKAQAASKRMLLRLYQLAQVTGRPYYDCAWMLYDHPPAEVVAALLTLLLGPWCWGNKYRYIAVEPERLDKHEITPTNYLLVAKAIKQAPKFAAFMLCYATAVNNLNTGTIIWPLLWVNDASKWEAVLTSMLKDHQAFSVHRAYVIKVLMRHGQAAKATYDEAYRELRALSIEQAFQQRYYDFLHYYAGRAKDYPMLGGLSMLEELYKRSSPQGPLLFQHSDKKNFRSFSSNLSLPPPIAIAAFREFTPVVSKDVITDLTLQFIPQRFDSDTHTVRYTNLDQPDNNWYLRLGDDPLSEFQLLLKTFFSWNANLLGFYLADALLQEGVSLKDLSLPDQLFLKRGTLDYAAFNRLCYSQSFRASLSGALHRQIYSKSLEDDNYFYATMLLLSYPEHRRFDQLTDEISDPSLKGSVV